MNIWAWVERAQEELRAAGRGRLADLMDLVPEYMSDNKHEQLDAIMPEAIALAREAKQPWIEVFLRHWQLQSCILQRYLIREYLPEAVSLIELANRDETRDCPQSICTTQDLANCYAHADGPGYAKERLAVASETLARITPDWPCFTCISGEYATALIDSNNAQGALDLIHRQKDELVRIGRADRRDDMCGTEIDALVLLGRLEDALDLNERAQDKLRGDSFMEFRRLDRARILARMGRLEEAKKTLPPYETIVRTQSQYEPWVDAVEHLALAGMIDNDWKLFAQLESLHRLMKKNGVIRRAIRVAHAQARLALAKSRPHLAERSARAIEGLLPELRLPLGAPEELTKLREKIAAAFVAPIELPASPDDLIPALSGDLEHDLDVLERASATWPDHEAIALSHSGALAAIHDIEGAKQVLEKCIDRASDGGPEALLRLLHLLRTHGERGELERVAEAHLANPRSNEVAARCHWAVALLHYERGELEPAITRLHKILELKPDAVNTALLLAQIDRKKGRLEEAMERLDALALRTEPGAVDWERMVVGTLLSRWDAVRDSAKRIGFELEGEGPIERDGELIRVRYDDNRTVYALRTGPVTARIVEIGHPELPQHFRDRVLIDARPLNDPPKEGEESQHSYIYSHLETLESGGYVSFAIDGFHPGDEALRHMRQAIAEHPASLEVRSDERYKVVDDSGEEARGLFALLAIHEDADFEAVKNALDESSEDFKRPLVWPDLLTAIGADDEAESQRVLAERYGLF